MTYFLEAALRKLDFVFAQHQATRIGQFIFQWRAGNAGGPVRCLDDHAHANFFTRAVNATVGE